MILRPFASRIMAINARASVPKASQNFVHKMLVASGRPSTSMLNSLSFRWISASNVASSNSNKPISLDVTDKAKKRLRQLSSEKKDIYLRIVVDSGGCNGYLAKFQLDEKPLAKDDMLVLDENGAKVVMDRITESLIKGATIDYEASLARSAFVIAENPNATSQCGCKVSFGV